MNFVHKGAAELGITTTKSAYANLVNFNPEITRRSGNCKQEFNKKSIDRQK